jgi:hypothetical protein
MSPFTHVPLPFVGLQSGAGGTAGVWVWAAASIPPASSTIDKAITNFDNEFIIKFSLLCSNTPNIHMNELRRRERRFDP